MPTPNEVERRLFEMRAGLVDRAHETAERRRQQEEEQQQQELQSQREAADDK
jgi:hypothetical protein